jgi:hypothetical protein
MLVASGGSGLHINCSMFSSVSSRAKWLARFTRDPRHRAFSADRETPIRMRQSKYLQARRASLRQNLFTT